MDCIKHYKNYKPHKLASPQVCKMIVLELIIN